MKVFQGLALRGIPLYTCIEVTLIVISWYWCSSPYIHPSHKTVFSSACSDGANSCISYKAVVSLLFVLHWVNCGLSELWVKPLLLAYGHSCIPVSQEEQNVVYMRMFPLHQLTYKYLLGSWNQLQWLPSRQQEVGMWFGYQPPVVE